MNKFKYLINKISIRWFSSAIRINGNALTIKEVCSVAKKKKNS